MVSKFQPDFVAQQLRRQAYSLFKNSVPASKKTQLNASPLERLFHSCILKKNRYLYSGNHKKLIRAVWVTCRVTQC
jgi:hypothetical protein